MATLRTKACLLAVLLNLGAAAAWPYPYYQYFPVGTPVDNNHGPFTEPDGALLKPLDPDLELFNYGTASSPDYKFMLFTVRCRGDSGASYQLVNMSPQINGQASWTPLCYNAYGALCANGPSSTWCCEMAPRLSSQQFDAQAYSYTLMDTKGGFLFCAGPPPPPPPSPSPPPLPSPPPYPPAPPTPTATYDVPPPPVASTTIPWQAPPAPVMTNATTPFAGVLYGDCAAVLGSFAAAAPLMQRPDQMRTARLYCVGSPGAGVPFAVGSNNGQPNCFRQNGKPCVAGTEGCPCGVVSGIDNNDFSGAGKCLICPEPAPITAPTYGACTNIFKNWNPYYGPMKGTLTSGVFGDYYTSSGALSALVSCNGYPGTYQVGDWTVGGYVDSWTWVWTGWFSGYWRLDSNAVWTQASPVACYNSQGNLCAPGSAGCPCNMVQKPQLGNGLWNGGGQCLICPPPPSAPPPPNSSPPPPSPSPPPLPPSPFYLSAAGLDGTCLSSPGSVPGFAPYTSLSYSFCYDTGAAMQVAITQVTNALECDGNDMQSMVSYEASSPATCAAYCADTFPGSKAFAYRPHSGPNCRCKSALPAPVGPMWNNSYGYSCYLMGAMLPGRYIMSAQNFECAGNDVVGTVTQQASSEANCASMCATVAGATGFTFKSGACACKAKVVPTRADVANSNCYIFNTPPSGVTQFAASNNVDMVPYALPLGVLSWDGVAKAFLLKGAVAPKSIGGDGFTYMVGTLKVACATSQSLNVSQTTLFTKNFGVVACQGCGNFTFSYAGPKACIAPPPAPLAPTIGGGAMAVSTFTSRVAGKLSLSTSSSGFPAGLVNGCVGNLSQSAAAAFSPVQLTASKAASPQACAAVVSAPGSYLGLDVCPVQVNGFSLKYSFSISQPSASFNSIAAGLSLSFVNASPGAVPWKTDAFGLAVPTTNNTVTVRAAARRALALDLLCGVLTACGAPRYSPVFSSRSTRTTTRAARGARTAPARARGRALTAAVTLKAR